MNNVSISTMIGADLTHLFNPTSIAVIGASASAKKLGAIVIRNIIDSGYQGKVFPINPNESVIQDLPCYPNLGSVPELPDLAVVAIPAAGVLEVLDQIGQKGTKNVVILTAGFKESGEEGAQLEENLVAIAHKYQLNVLGPNCLGFVNTRLPVNVTFGEIVKSVSPLRFISQSGAIASSVFDWATYSQIGFSEFITLGNKADVAENDVLEYFLQTPVHSNEDERGISHYRPIGMYLESIIDGKKFIDVCSRISKNDPIFVLKPGKSEQAQKAMQSHTGSLAGEDAVFDAALKKANIIRCEGIEDFFDLAKAFSWEQAPVGKNVAIISNAGGPAVMTSDFVSEAGLQLVAFDEQTSKKLQEHLPKAASIVNPIDVLGDALADRYGQAIETVLQSDAVDALIVILTPQIMTQIQETATVIGELSLKYQKPIFCSFMGGSLIAKGESVLNSYRIPSFRYPERAVSVMAKMYAWNANRLKVSQTPQAFVEQLPQSAQIFSDLSVSGRTTADSFEANDIMSEFGILTPPTKKCLSFDDAKSFVATYQYPVVMKISSPNVLHKSDIGGVVTNISSEEQLMSAYQKLETVLHTLPNPSNIDSIQIQTQAPKGVEVLVGIKSDAFFGHVVQFGAGGLLANLIADRNLAVLPTTRQQLQELVEGSKVFSLLSGFRGEQAYDIASVVTFLELFTKISMAFPQISQMDINPCIITHEGVFAVDGKILL